MATIVQINFGHDVSEEELAASYNPAGAERIAAVNGLQWKVWLRSPERRESGGIYLFESQADADAYIAGPIVEGIRTNAAYADVSIKVFDVREAPSAITRAPLHVGAGAVAAD